MARTSRFGRPGIGEDLLSVNFNARNVLRLTDTITGKFRGGAFQRAISQTNEDAAVKIQVGMVKALREKIKRDRTQRPGKRLEVALLHENNREVTASGFTVLRPSWMDRSPAALYWRQIEYGNDTIYFTQVWFTSDFQNFYAPWSPGGSTAQSQRRNSRTGGALYSRPKPPGYKHMRMPMHQPTGVPVAAGPFPEYDFVAGGERVFQAYDFAGQFRKRCKAVGINLSAGDFR